MSSRGAALALVLERALGPIVDVELVGAVQGPPPSTDFSGDALTMQVAEVREVRVDLEREPEERRMLAEVGEVDVLVHSLARVSREPHFERLACDSADLATSRVRRTRIDAGRQRDVVAKPRVLLDVGQHHRPRLLTVDEPAVAREKPRLMDEEAMLATLIDEAVQAGREHGAALAHVSRAESRQQSRERSHRRPPRSSRSPLATGIDYRPNWWPRRASASAPSERPKSRSAISKYPGISSRFTMMPASQPATMRPPTDGFTATTMPASTSMTLTASMNVCGATGRNPAMAGARY